MGSIVFSRSFQVYLQLRSRHLTLPWLRRGGLSLTGTGTVRCTQNDFSTARVKHSQVPESVASLRKQKPTEDSHHGGVLEHHQTVCDNASEKRLGKAASLPKKRVKKQAYVDTDAKRPTSVCRNASENRQLNAVGLDDDSSCEESEISEKEISKSLLEDAENVAIQLLAGRAFTVAELRKKLHGKKCPVQVVDKVIADIKARGLVNDGLYAESFSQSKWLSGTWGPRRIKQALIQKGVSQAEANKATRKVFEDNDDENDRNNYASSNHYQENAHFHESESSNTQLIMSESSMDHLFIQASKQWLRGQDLSTESRKARVVRWLQYRGFNWGVVTVILQRLQSRFANLQDDGNINIKKTNGGASRGSKMVQESTSEESMDKLFVEVSKQWIKGKDTTIENRKARITRWLLYRGHSWEVVKIILKRLQSQ